MPFLFILIAVFVSMSQMSAAPLWMTIPPTPSLPNPDHSGYAQINGIKIWYAIFGRGEPVILLHGGLANSNYWGKQVPVLAKAYQVIVMDSRGQGRSSRDAQPFSYNLMASDVIGLMDCLRVQRAAMVGWSDGAIIGLVMVMHYPERVTRLFAFGANSNPRGVREDVGENPAVKESLARREKEYQQLSTTPDEFNSIRDRIREMQRREPDFTAQQLQGITVPTWIVDGDHDEAIKRENTLFLADQIPNARLLIQPGVSHFAFLQDPGQSNDDLLHFLQQR
jgi:pimeloyl-ACP methyl ester carboxylesterase